MYLCTGAAAIHTYTDLVECAGKLPHSFNDTVKGLLGNKAKLTGPLLTHCHRKLFHAQWEVILDNDFLHAYMQGIVINCPDGVSCCSGSTCVSSVTQPTIPKSEFRSFLSRRTRQVIITGQNHHSRDSEPQELPLPTLSGQVI